ncbi:Irc6p [Saccharomyces cerevisiae YJM1399]|nr:Irc6p [Saccharomyces cerevisiae YJM1399]
MVLQYPQNKILVLSDHPHNFSKTQFLQDLFHCSSTGISIVKNQTWENRYYKVHFDLYIDSCKDIPVWVEEFITPECEPLRNVMAGIILITDIRQTKPQELLHQFMIAAHRNTFVVLVNVNEEVEQDEIDELNEIWSNAFTNVIEFVNWKRSKPTVNHNDYGEKLGLDRIQEIIDTHDWLNCEVLPATKIREEIPNEMPLEQIIRNLQSARLKYKSIENSSEADAFANEMADELSRYL